MRKDRFRRFAAAVDELDLTMAPLDPFLKQGHAPRALLDAAKEKMRQAMHLSRSIQADLTVDPDLRTLTRVKRLVRHTHNLCRISRRSGSK